jgi:peptide/nickel transport system substrate-binding protein
MKKLVRILMTAALVAGLLLPVCSLQAAPTTPSPTPSAGGSATPGATPQYGGKIVWIQNGSPLNLGYPATMDGTSQYSATPALEPLMDVDDQGRFLPTGLTTNYVLASDGKSVTLTLRRGVKFHDGTDFNAQAAKWNLDSVMQGKLIGTSTWASTDVIDTYTVRLNLIQRDYAVSANLGGVTTFMVSPTAVQKNGVDWARSNPVGTGPFKLKSFSRDVSVIYVKNSDYWQKGLPYLDGIDILVVKDPMVQAAALQAKEANVLQSISDYNVVTDLRNKGFALGSLAPTTLYILTPDSKNADSALAKVAVREALEYATNKETIAQAVGYGFWHPLKQTAHSSWLAAFNPNITGRAYDPARAKQLLASAGYPNGFSTKIIYQQAVIDQNALVAIQSQWKAVGVDVTLNPVPQATFVATRTNGWHDGFILIRSNVEQVFTNSFDRLLSADGKSYTSTLRPPGYGSLLSDAMASPDYATYQTRTQKVMQLVYDQATWHPLWAYPQINILDKSVRDANFYTKENMILWTPEKAWISKP